MGQNVSSCFPPNRFPNTDTDRHRTERTVGAVITATERPEFSQNSINVAVYTLQSIFGSCTKNKKAKVDDICQGV